MKSFFLTATRNSIKFKKILLLTGAALSLSLFSFRAQAMESGLDRLEEAKKRLQALPICSTSDAQDLHAQGYTGNSVGIALCDTGFSRAIKSERLHQSTDEDILWDSLNNDLVQPLRQYANPQVVSSRAKCTSLHLFHHGSHMMSHLRAIAPRSIITPIEIDEKAESWIKAFTDLAEDPTIQIINASWPMPGIEEVAENPYLMDPECKKALLTCLQKGKIVVLAAGNVAMNIPQRPGDEEEIEKEAPNDPINGDALDLSLFYGLLSPNQEATLRREWREEREAEREAHKKEIFWRGYYNFHHRISTLFQDYETESPLFSHFLVVGSSAEDSLEVKDESVKPGKGAAQNHYVYVNADHARSYFVREGGMSCVTGKVEEKGWGGTSSSTAAATGLIACLWEASGLETPGSKIVESILETCQKDETFDPAKHGKGKINPLGALKQLGK